jgi:hypothetical protein
VKAEQIVDGYVNVRSARGSTHLREFLSDTLSPRRFRPRLPVRQERDPYADFCCGFADGFFVAVSLAAFLPLIGISISFWPALLSAAAPPTLRRSASLWLMRSTSAVS